jgi:putative NIF3 family GTP cyclohydrolase 1 type 2
MKITHSLSRRHFLEVSALSALGCSLPQMARGASSNDITARQLVEEVQRYLGAAPGYTSVRDKFKAGSPDIVVHGAAVTFMSTLDVLKRAHAAGLNFVITHEPTIWSDADTVSDVEQDPLYKYKMHFIESNGMAVWRIHDLWHAQQPEPMSDAEGKLLDWNRYLMPGSHGYYRVYKLPRTPLKTVAAYLATKLNTRSVRLVGDPNLMIETLAHGSHGLEGNINGLEAADAVMIGEARDWDSMEYIRDLSASGQKKGAIVISHEASEEEGMKFFTQWFRSHFASVRAEFIPTTDRLWIA